MKWMFFRENWVEGLPFGVMLLLWFVALWFWMLWGLP